MDNQNPVIDESQTPLVPDVESNQDPEVTENNVIPEINTSVEPVQSETVQAENPTLEVGEVGVEEFTEGELPVEKPVDEISNATEIPFKDTRDAITFVTLKSNLGNYEMTLKIDRQGKWFMDYTGGIDHAEESAQLLFNNLMGLFSSEMDRSVKEFLNISYLGVKKFGAKSYPVRINTDGTMLINGLSEVDFVTSLSKEELEGVAVDVLRQGR